MSPNLRALFRPSPMIPPRSIGEHGACAIAVNKGKADADLWVPDDELPEKDRIEHSRKAITWCRTCPVQPDCLQFALSNPEVRGVYGGYVFNLKVGRKAAGLVYAYASSRAG